MKLCFVLEDWRCRQVVLEGSTLVSPVRRTVPVLHTDDTGSGKHATDEGPELYPAAHGTTGRRHQEACPSVD